MPEGQLKTKHLRAQLQPTDGTHISIPRRWPRGVAKGELFSGG